jgi:hypothetical protein
MAVLMVMRWPGVTLEQYDYARENVNWETEQPDGAIFHVSAHDGANLRVVDVWETAEQFQRFVDARLMPALAPLGIETQPEIEILPAHAVYEPAAIRV